MDYGPGGALCYNTLDAADDHARQACKRSGVWTVEHWDPTESLKNGRIRLGRG